MNQLTDSNNLEGKTGKQDKVVQYFDSKFKFVLYFYFILILIYLTLNFLGSPLLQWLFLLITIITFLIVFIFRWQKAFIFTIIFCLIEGQGRVLWSYQPFFRICFDLLLAIPIIRSFLVKKKIVEFSYLPKFITVMIVFHFLWFFVSLFNPLGVGPIYGFATSKYYIFPFFLFFAFVQNPINFESKEFQKLVHFINFIIFSIGALCIYQVYVGDQLMSSISLNFVALFEKFTYTLGILFRPFGTSMVPGGMSTFFVLTVGFLFISPVKGLWYKLYFLIFIIISWVALFLSQVRAALISHILIFFGCQLVSIMASKKRGRELIILLFSGILITVVLFNLVGKHGIIGKYIDIASSTARVEELFTERTIQRAGPSVVFGAVYDKLSRYPFGFGPGMCTQLMQVIIDRRLNHPELEWTDFWSWDNLYAFVLQELGFGGLFYLIVIVFIPLLLLLMTLKAFKLQDLEVFRIVGISSVVTIVITISNWGGIGIPFNPVSFFYWFWVAIGLNEYYSKYKTLEIMLFDSKNGQKVS